MRSVAMSALLVLSCVHIFLVMRYAATVIPLGGDARSYIAAARVLREGQNPVEVQLERFLPEAEAEIPVYLYPPFLALLLLPLAQLPYATALALWMILVGVTTLVLIIVLQRLVPWYVALCGVLFFLPTWQSLWLGQINALIAVLLTLALLACVQQKDVRAGVALAIGALLKITPALSLLVLGFHQRWRGLVAAAVTGLIVVVGSLLLTTIDVWYTGSLYAATSTWTSPLLLSWTAILRQQPGSIATVGPLVVTAIMLLVSLLRMRQLSPAMGFAVSIILPLLIAGVVWHYSAVTVLPALAVLWQHNARARLLALVTWAMISLIGGIFQPIMLTLCWLVCCWPNLLGSRESLSGTSAISKVDHISG